MEEIANDFAKRVIDGGQTFFEHHKCGGCKCPVGYRIQNGAVFYDSNCECTTYYSDLQPRGWNEFEEFTKAWGINV